VKSRSENPLISVARGRVKIFLWGIVGLLLVVYFYVVFPIWGLPFSLRRHPSPPLTPAWALEPWLWEDDHNTAERVEELLAGYAAHDIPVRTILLDSPWSTRYNDFVVDTSRYPNPEAWLRSLQERGYRVVLWMTCMVNSRNRDTRIRDSRDFYLQAKENRFLAGNGHQVKWWKGQGGFIDYTYPDALQWWHTQQHALFALGLDGWKLDDPATFFSSSFFGIPFPYQRVYSGLMTTRGYMDHYYREEYRHGLEQNPEFITLVRSFDRLWTHPEGFAPLDAAPVCWVGDQQHIWSGDTVTRMDASQPDLLLQGKRGLAEAIGDVLRSSQAGYGVVGSDVGGFSGRQIPADLYIRWAQFSTFCGLFMNGGHGERALWKKSREELEIIRKFSWLHQELIPYIYSHVHRCHEGGLPLQRPCGPRQQYLFGDDFFITPIVRPDLQAKVDLPVGQWRYFFHDTHHFQGPMSFHRSFPLDEYPVFVREGALVPMRIQRAYTGLADGAHGECITWLIYPFSSEDNWETRSKRSTFFSFNSKPQQEENQFTLYYPDGSASTTVHLRQSDGRLNIVFSGAKHPHVLRILSLHKPMQILLDQQPLIEGRHWQYEADRRLIFVETDHYQMGHYEILY